jgi:hypothetical protein
MGAPDGDELARLLGERGDQPEPLFELPPPVSTASPGAA